jgi:membrane protein
MNLLRQLFAYLRFVTRRFVEDRCLMVAGSLTYTSLLALVPLFTVTITLTSNVPFMRNVTLQVKTFVLKNLVPDVGGKVVTIYMEQFAQNAAKLTVIGLLIVVATAVALMFTIDGAFNDIWRAKRRHTWWKRLLSYLAVLSVGPVLIGVSLSLTSYVVHWTQSFDRVLPFLDDWLLKLVPFLLTTVALVLAYRIMPSRHVPLRHALIGGVLAGLLFEIVKHLFVVFVIRIPTYSLVYGTFAGFPIFLVWLFCCWMVVLAGAEIAATLSYFRHADAWARPTASKFSADGAIRIVDALAEAGAGLSLSTLIFKAPMPIEIAEDNLHAMIEANLIREEPRGRYALILAREAISNDEIVRAVSV